MLASCIASKMQSPPLHVISHIDSPPQSNVQPPPVQLNMQISASHVIVQPPAGQSSSQSPNTPLPHVQLLFDPPVHASLLPLPLPLPLP
jgi:hypothetical protein